MSSVVNYYQPNTFAPYSSQINPLVLPHYARPVVAPFYVSPIADTLPIISPTKPSSYSSYSEAMAATGLASIIKRENSSVTTLLDSFLTLNDEQGRPNNEIEASNTELTVISEMPRISVSRALKVAIGKGYITLLKTGTASGEKSRYRLNLPFCFVDTKRGHNKYPQNDTTSKPSGYEQTKLELNGKIEVSENSGYKGWVQNDTTSDTASTDTNAQEQTHTDVRDSNRISTLNINNSTINSRTNRNTESRVGASIQAHEQEQAQMSAPVFTPLATVQAQPSAPTRARNRSRTNAPNTNPLQLTLNLNLTGFAGQTQTIAAAPGITLTIQQEQVQPQPITDHINEMVATGLVATATAPQPAAAPDTVAVPEIDVTKIGDYSYNLPVSAIVDVEPAQVAATASPIEPTTNVVADNVAASATVAEYPKHNITSSQQLANEPWKPRLKPKTECPKELAELVELISKKFGNVTGIRSNVTQTANLLADSKLPTNEFGTLMQRSASLTLTFAKARPQDKPGKRNLMPYFFATLRDQIAKSLDGSLTLEELLERYDADSKLFPIRRAGTNNQPEMFPDVAYGLESSATDSNAGDADEPEAEFAEFSKDLIAEIKPISAAMASAVTMRDKETGANLDVFGSRIEGDVLFAKFYRPNGPCDVSRWASWLMPYGISRVEVI